MSNTSNGKMADGLPQVVRRDERQCVTLTFNGRERSAYCEPRDLLSDFIRHELGATGTHVGCEHGVCGACTVHVGGVAARSCLMLAVQAQGQRIERQSRVAGNGMTEYVIRNRAPLFLSHGVAESAAKLGIAAWEASMVKTRR